MHLESKLKKIIRKYLLENYIFQEYDEDMIDEERIANTDAKTHVMNRENFIGSHIWGENYLDKLYVAYSYGTQFPAYVWYKNRWYHNVDEYRLEDGTVNKFTKKHMDLMRPTLDTFGLSTYHLQKMINDFMDEHNIKGPTHVSVEPGEKN